MNTLMSLPYVVAITFVAFAAGLWLGVLLMSMPGRRRDDAPERLHSAVPAPAWHDEPDLFDDIGRLAVEGGPPKPYSEFDGVGQHAGGPLYSQRPGV